MDKTEYDAWEPVRNSNGMLKRFEVGDRGYIYAAFTFIPTKWDNLSGHPIQNEHWKMVNAFFVPRTKS